MEISANMVKELRDRTGAGMMDCKKALVEAEGSLDRASEIIVKKGLAKAAKKSDRAASEGLVHSYIHQGGRIGVLVEVNCETDFVARTEAFKEFVDDVSLQIAANPPVCVRREEVPAELVAKQREIFEAQVRGEGKPDKIVPKIVDGKIDKWYSEVCLLEQPFVKEPGQTIEQVRTAVVSKTGENVQIRRFVRFELGEGV
ncbi:MAG: translation elongation factor Ts [Deltaproteobacteria bacterium]|nr:translation elongation factor Ts [Deltaproteobacteria bacterium]